MSSTTTDTTPTNDTPPPAPVVLPENQPKPELTWSIYRLSDGAIIGSARSSTILTTSSTVRGMISGTFDGGAFYVDQSVTPPVATARAPNGSAIDSTSIALHTGVATISGIPNGATLAIDSDAPQTITDGVVAFSADVAGTYTLVIANWPMTPSTYEVVVA